MNIETNIKKENKEGEILAWLGKCTKSGEEIKKETEGRNKITIVQVFI